MGSSRLAFAAVGLACVAAAAGGSYIATRQNVAERAATTVAASEVASAPTTAPSTPVQETEGIVGEPARAAVAAERARPAATPSSARPQAAPAPAKPSAP